MGSDNSKRFKTISNRQTTYALCNTSFGVRWQSRANAKLYILWRKLHNRKCFKRKLPMHDSCKSPVFRFSQRACIRTKRASMRLRHNRSPLFYQAYILANNFRFRADQPYHIIPRLHAHKASATALLDFFFFDRQRFFALEAHTTGPPAGLIFVFRW